MAQRLANVRATVKFIGRNPDSISRVYAKMVQMGCSRMNKRTGKAFTMYSDLSDIIGKKRSQTAYADVFRPMIIGNWQNDIQEFARRAAEKLNVDVTTEIVGWDRKEIEE